MNLEMVLFRPHERQSIPHHLASSGPYSPKKFPVRTRANAMIFIGQSNQGLTKRPGFHSVVVSNGNKVGVNFEGIRVGMEHG